MPALPEGDDGEAIARGIIDGIYRFSAGPETAPKNRKNLRASLCFSGPMWSVAKEAQELLAVSLGGVGRHLGRDLVEPPAPRRPRGRALEPPPPRRRAPAPPGDRGAGLRPDPVVAITDYMRAVPDQVARFIDRPYTSLGTDGFGRSDARAALREHFEVDAAHLVLTVLSELARAGQLETSVVEKAITDLGVDTARAAPFDI